jgi:hypothetical protein
MTMPRGQHWISKAAATAGSISHFAVAIEHSDQLSALPPPFSPTPCPKRGGGGRQIKAPGGREGLAEGGRKVAVVIEAGGERKWRNEEVKNRKRKMRRGRMVVGDG